MNRGKGRLHDREEPATDDYATTTMTGTEQGWARESTASLVQEFGDGDLARVREFTATCAASAGLDQERATDLVYAVNEAATNAIEHGGGHGTLRARWSSTHIVVAVWSPAGGALDPSTGTMPPDPRAVRGRGLWLIRQLTDLLEIRPDPAGVTLHLHMRVRAATDGQELTTGATSVHDDHLPHSRRTHRTTPLLRAQATGRART